VTFDLDCACQLIIFVIDCCLCRNVKSKRVFWKEKISASCNPFKVYYNVLACNINCTDCWSIVTLCLIFIKFTYF